MSIKQALQLRHFHGKVIGLEGDELNKFVQDYVFENIRDLHVLSEERAAWMKEARNYAGEANVHGRDDYTPCITGSYRVVV